MSDTIPESLPTESPLTESYIKDFQENLYFSIGESVGKNTPVTALVVGGSGDFGPFFQIMDRLNLKQGTNIFGLDEEDFSNFAVKIKTNNPISYLGIQGAKKSVLEIEQNTLKQLIQARRIFSELTLPYALTALTLKEYYGDQLKLVLNPVAASMIAPLCLAENINFMPVGSYVMGDPEVFGTFFGPKGKEGTYAGDALALKITNGIFNTLAVNAGRNQLRSLMDILGKDYELPSLGEAMGIPRSYWGIQYGDEKIGNVAFHSGQTSALDVDLPLPENLRDFLDKNHDVDILFVSGGNFRDSNSENRERAARELLDAIEQSQQPTIIVESNALRLDDSDSDTIFRTSNPIPLSELRGLLRGVIHFGGAGITNFAIQNGIPQIGLPISSEQAANVAFAAKYFPDLNGGRESYYTFKATDLLAMIQNLPQKQDPAKYNDYFSAEERIAQELKNWIHDGEA